MSDNLLNIGKSGLFSAKKSLETTGHNIANANTEGYSRQKTIQQSSTPVIKDGFPTGTGSVTKGTKRSHDKFIEKKLNFNVSQNKYFKERAQQLGQIENIFNEIDTEGLNKILNKFYNAFRELSGQPENETLRSVVRDTARLVVKDFRRIKDTLGNLANNVGEKTKYIVQTTNELTREIAHLNKQVRSLEVSGGETGDLRDQRDLLIQKLSENFHVNTYIDGKGNFVVNAKNVGTLVSGGQSVDLDVGAASKDKSTNKTDGSIEVFFAKRPGRPISERFQGGELSSVLQVRNKDIRNLQDKIDELAFNFAKTTNSIHRRGFVNRKLELGPNGETPPFDMMGKTTGINFFEEPTMKEGAADRISLSEEVQKDLSNIATALEPNAPGDNRVALAIAKVQHEKIYDGGQATIEEEYLKTIANVGLEVGKSNFDHEQSEGILAQTKALKERVSGVSIDEETANMVRYQHAYDASARVMRAADEMFQTVLGIKR